MRANSENSTKQEASPEAAGGFLGNPAARLRVGAVSARKSSGKSNKKLKYKREGHQPINKRHTPGLQSVSRVFRRTALNAIDHG